MANENNNTPKTPENKTDAMFLDGTLLAKMAQGGAAQLRSNSDEVNKLNIFPVPDGDTGDNMRMTIESGIAALENTTSGDLAEVMRTLSRGMLLGARGNSGVILSQFFAGVAKGFESSEKADARTLGHALELGVKQAYASVMTPTEGTILTVAREAVEFAVARVTPTSTIRSLFGDLVKEMQASLNRTPEILTVLKEAGVVDSGGAGLLYIMDGFNRVLNGEKVETETAAAPVTEAAPTIDLDAFGPDSVMTYGYCTELLIRLQNSKTNVEAFDIEPLKQFLAELGDSVVAFKTDSIVKLHVHTLTPEKVLAHCRTFGEFLTIKIENMSVQHSEIEAEREAARVSEKPAEHKRYGMVTVALGPGIEDLFREAGVDQIVQGGQTQNPSTNDFLDAFARISADHIFVFPNNGNILMAAQQAADIYEDAQVHVIPTKNIGTGYVAASSLDVTCDDVETNIEAMTEAMARVTAGYISPSIRDADLNGVHINNGDTIGIIEKEIVVSDPDRTEATHALIGKLLEDPEKFMLTIFCGHDTTEEECNALVSYLAEAYPDTEVYAVNGGQEIYPYIIIAE